VRGAVVSRRAKRARRRRNLLRARAGTAVRLATAAAVLGVEAHRRRCNDSILAAGGTPNRPAHRKHVNWGWCEQVAEHARELLAGWGHAAQVVCDDEDLRVPWLCPESELLPPCHWWLYVDELRTHHDAEAPRGVECWTRLPLFLRHALYEPGSVQRTSPVPAQRQLLEWRRSLLARCLREAEG